MSGYEKILAVYDNDPAGQAALAVLSQYPRIHCIHPPAHDLTDCWLSGSDLLTWIQNHLH